MIITALTFVTCLAAFVLIGLLSARKAHAGERDYYLASNDVAPWLAGLSAVATNNSGYMFIGVIGFTYVTGLAAIWLMFGWIVGDCLGSLIVHRRLREVTAETGEVSFISVVARWSQQNFPTWRRLAALLSIVFLGAYAAAQIGAGGKALQGVLGWSAQSGACISALLVLAYTTFGGIRASIWTDAAQSAVMLFAMAMLLLVAVDAQGGVASSLTKMAEIPHYLDLFPQYLLVPGMLGIGLFILGWMAAGLSVIGQPHIMVRFMALKSPSDVMAARLWYYSYFTIFYGLATAVGMMSRLILPDLGALDPELALPQMAVELLPPALVGIMLAGIFAATMSTADSLVLSCSASLTHDLFPAIIKRTWVMRLVTSGVTILALIFALQESQSIFSLVILAWSTLACAFGPLILINASGRRVNEFVAIFIMLLGVGIAFQWRMLGWHTDIYEGLPGILLPTVLGFAFSQSRKPTALRPYSGDRSAK